MTMRTGEVRAAGAALRHVWLRLLATLALASLTSVVMVACGSDDDGETARHDLASADGVHAWWEEISGDAVRFCAAIERDAPSPERLCLGPYLEGARIVVDDQPGVAAVRAIDPAPDAERPRALVVAVVRRAVGTPPAERFAYVDLPAEYGASLLVGSMRFERERDATVCLLLPDAAGEPVSVGVEQQTDDSWGTSTSGPGRPCEP
jgi:hypothetical protein